MKKIIKDTLYDTENAEMLAAAATNEIEGICCFGEILYRTESGKYFIGIVSSENRSIYRMNIMDIQAISEKKAKKWISENADIETYIRIFGEIED